MPEAFLEIGDRRKLTALLAGLYDFTDLGPRGRRVFLQNTAGLGRFVPGLDLTGPPETVAGDIIGRLERFGQLPDRESYHALGALLAAMHGLNDLADEDKAFIARAVVRYGLVADAAYVQELRATHNLQDAPVRPPSAQAMAPSRSGAGAPPGPAFAPQIDDEPGLEAIINSADNFLDIHLLRGALYSSRAVARIEIPEGTAKGTGFLVGPDLLLTNQHVLQQQSVLEAAVARFDFLSDPSGIAEGKGSVVPFKPDFYFASPAEELDYALVRLASAPLKTIAVEDARKAEPIAALLAQGKHKGYLSLAPHLLVAQSRVNIVQHPDGDPLKAVLTQNYVSHVTDTRVQYVADTMEGSSGSPVFNGFWEVVALHHSGKPYPPQPIGDALKKVWKGRFRANEGIPMPAMLGDFRTRKIDRYLPDA